VTAAEISTIETLCTVLHIVNDALAEVVSNQPYVRPYSRMFDREVR
jgi:hypothetical protein